MKQNRKSEDFETTWRFLAMRDFSKIKWISGEKSKIKLNKNKPTYSEELIFIHALRDSVYIRVSFRISIYCVVQTIFNVVLPPIYRNI